MEGFTNNFFFGDDGVVVSVDDLKAIEVAFRVDAGFDSHFVTGVRKML